MAQSDIIESRPLVELVRERLIADILEHRYKPAQKLPVAEVSSRYGVSETPVKQAFSRLVSEGLLEALPRRGVMVRRPSREDVFEIIEVRHMLNFATVDAAIEHYHAADQPFRGQIERNLSAHEALLPILHETLEIDLFLRYVRLDIEFHHLFVQCLGNSIIERQFQQLYNQVRTFISLSHLVAERVRGALADHRAIVTAITTGDPLAVLDAMFRHKTNAMQIMMAIFSEEELS